MKNIFITIALFALVSLCIAQYPEVSIRQIQEVPPGNSLNSRPTDPNDICFEDIDIDVQRDSTDDPCIDTTYIYVIIHDPDMLAELDIYYRYNLTAWMHEPLTQIDDTLYVHAFPPLLPESRVDYYLQLTDTLGNVIKVPTEAPFNFYSIYCTEVGINDEPPLPTATALYQNYPNPFNISTTISYSLTEPAAVKLVIYDILGREIRTLMDDYAEPGQHAVTFDATGLPSGFYFYRLQAGKFSDTKRMILLK
jgi:hypothetical protein